MNNDWVSENRALERKERMKDHVEDELDKLAPVIQHWTLVFLICLIITAALCLLALLPAGTYWLIMKIGEASG